MRNVLSPRESSFFGLCWPVTNRRVLCGVPRRPESRPGTQNRGEARGWISLTEFVVEHVRHVLGALRLGLVVPKRMVSDPLRPRPVVLCGALVADKPGPSFALLRPMESVRLKSSFDREPLETGVGRLDYQVSARSTGHPCTTAAADLKGDRRQRRHLSAKTCGLTRTQ